MTSKSEFSNKIIDWYKIHGRKKLPWQIKKTPYKIWISEIMLQQTQMIRVIPYFKRFIKQFPNIKKLAKTELNTILYLWSGLGYYARAHNIYKTAKIIVNKYQSIFPTDFEILITLPGIGRSTAGAILSLAFKKKQAILDTNVKRIITRYYTINGWPGNSQIEKTLWETIKNILPNTKTANFNQGLMDIGELICTKTHPKCTLCPLETTCQANLQKITHIYPFKKPKKTTLKKNIWLLILQCKNTVWIEQCRSEQIWEGLFCFPKFATYNQLKVWSINNNLNINTYKKLPILQHTLSNYRVQIIPIIYTINKTLHIINTTNNGLWFDLTKPQILGFPQPMLKLLQKINLPEKYTTI